METSASKLDILKDYALGGLLTAARREAYRQTPAFKKRSRAWNESQCGRYEMVGATMELFRKYQPQSLAEWEHIYLAHGKSLEHLDTVVAPQYRAYTGVDSLEALLSVLIHTIDATWRGAQLEQDALTLLRTVATNTAPERGLTFRLSSRQEDSEYAIDIVGMENDSIAYAFQVKPASFFQKGVVENVKKSEQQKLAYFQMRFPDAVLSYLSSRDVVKQQVKFIF